MQHKPKAIVVDIDGTLILFGGELNKNLMAIIKKYRLNFLYKVLILTARQEHYRAETIKELRDLGVKYDKLFMNNTKHIPPVYKRGKMKLDILPHFDVIKVFDDDDSNIYEFQKLGLATVLINPETGEFMTPL